MGIERAIGQSRVRHDPGKPDRGDALLAKLPGRHLDDALAGRILVSLLVAHLLESSSLAQPQATPGLRGRAA